LWPGFFGRISPHLFDLEKPFPKTVFGSLVSGVSPLLDIPGTAQIHNLSSDVYLSKWHPLLLKNPLKDGGIGSGFGNLNFP